MARIARMQFTRPTAQKGGSSTREPLHLLDVGAATMSTALVWPWPEHAWHAAAASLDEHASFLEPAWTAPNIPAAMARAMFKGERHDTLPAATWRRSWTQLKHAHNPAQQLTIHELHGDAFQQNLGGHQLSLDAKPAVPCKVALNGSALPGSAARRQRAATAPSWRQLRCHAWRTSSPATSRSQPAS